MKKILSLTLITALAVGSLFFISKDLTAQQLQRTPPTLKLTDPMPANLFVELAKAINPAVVNISTSMMPRQNMYRDPMLDMLEQFYGIRPRSGRPNSQPNKPQRMGLGTGFIIREDGLVVTNAHVINGADLIEIQLTENSDKLYKAEVIGLDERTDIALIKFKPDTKLTVAALGSSDSTEVGEWVAAFGNPFGHGHSMSKGIISSKGREIEEINRLPLLQTDASINPGNSGGPLVNSRGLVIGVNSAIDARAQGIGFAIPIDEVKKIIPQLEQRGSIRKGFLGVALGDIDDYTAAQMGLDDYRGAVVVNIGDGPAKKAGLKIYDLITEFNGKKIKSSRDLSDAVASLEPGKTVKAKILRGEKSIITNITIAERPDEKRLAKNFKTNDDNEEPKKKTTSSNKSLGLTITDDKETKKPVIKSVEPGSIGDRAGFQAGDIILSINKAEPTSAKEADQAFKKGTNSVRVGRGRGMSIMTFDLP